MLQIKGSNIISFQKNIPNHPSLSSIRPLQKPPLPKKNKTKILRHDYLCDQRKQNMLNTRFLKKKQQLFDITKQNVRIFRKINDQKSDYSHQSLNKSYQSNKSLLNSRVSQRSKSNRSLKRSQISNKSIGQNKEKQSLKNKFFNRAVSAKPVRQSQKGDPKCISVKDCKGKSMINLRSIKIQETGLNKPQQLQQYTRLFNITQEPTLKQRNRANRIRSKKILRSITCPSSGSNKSLSINFGKSNNQFHSIRSKDNFSQQSQQSKSKQIVINEENDIQIHQQIETQESEENTFRNNKKSRAKSMKDKKQGQREKQFNVDNTENNDKKIMKQKNSIITLTNCLTQNNVLSFSKYSLKSLHNPLSQSNKTSVPPSSTRQNPPIQNLFQIKNTTVLSRLQTRMMKENKLSIKQAKKIGTKYTNLLQRINQQLSKTNNKASNSIYNSKNNNKVKQSSIYHYKSRLIA